MPSLPTVDVTTISNSYVTASETSYVTASGDDWVTAAEEFSQRDTPLSVYNMELSTQGAPGIIGHSGRRILALQNNLRDAVRRFLVRQREAGNVDTPSSDAEFLPRLLPTLHEGLALYDRARPKHLYLAHL